MRRPKLFVLAACLVVLVGLCVFSLIPGRTLIDMKLLTVEGFPETETNKQRVVVVLRLNKPDAPSVEFAEDLTVQFRIKGKWVSPEKLDGRFFVMVQQFPGCGQTGVIHSLRGAEAFRLHLIYRRESPREALHLWLYEHGWWRKVPKLCSWVYKRVPEHGKWRRRVIEIELPKQPSWSAPGYEPYEPPSNPPTHFINAHTNFSINSHGLAKGKTVAGLELS